MDVLVLFLTFQKFIFDFMGQLPKSQIKRQKDEKRRLKERKRASKKRPPRRLIIRYLIICEGEKTEPNYFKALIGSLGTSESKVIEDPEIFGLGRGTTSLLLAALRKKEELENDRAYTFDRCWLVFDKDDFPDFNNAIDEAQQKGFNVAWTNEAFELWYYLHFQYLDTPVCRDQYIKMINREIKKYIPNFKYEKNNSGMLEILDQFGKENKAMEFAQRLFELHHEETYECMCPCTTVYKLVQELRNPEKVLSQLNNDCG